MAAKIKFDSSGNPESPTLVLMTRSGKKIGLINYNSLIAHISLQNPSEISFRVNKYYNGVLNNIWADIVDLKLVWCVEYDIIYQISVEIDEEDDTIKIISGVKLSQSELSQIMLYDYQINTEDDIAREDYKAPTVFYNKTNKDVSLLDRMLEKAPHYTIIHVDSTLCNIQRTFSFDNVSLYDALKQVEDEIGCIFTFPKEGGTAKIRRQIAVFDMWSNCIDCGYRGDFTDVCPKCGSKQIISGYGQDTGVFVTSDELADQISIKADVDSVKNCLKLEAGDDLMTATIKNCNPNGSSYIWNITGDMKKDMTEELVQKIDDYDTLYNKYNNEKEYYIKVNTLSGYNNVVSKYNAYKNRFSEVSSPIIGFPNIINTKYDVIDLGLFIQTELMPDASLDDTSAEEQAQLLTTEKIGTISVSNIKALSLSSANSAVLGYCKCVIDNRYTTEIIDSSIDDSNHWIGTLKVTNNSDENDTANTSELIIQIDDNYETYVRQKVDKVFAKHNIDNVSIAGIFKLELEEFKSEMKKYSIDMLTDFHDACQAGIDILVEQGVGTKETWAGEKPNLYDDLYIPYYNKLMALEDELKEKENDLSAVKLMERAIDTYISKTHEALDFEKYLGEDLWLEFCCYRRDDKYTNQNYVSDGLSNKELFEKAIEFYECAKKEISQSAELQFSISATLNNLLVIDKFKPLLNDFTIGNWIRVEVDGKIYKLRLLDYEIDYDNLETLNVEFSNVLRSSYGISDQQSIISAVQSMATSYEYTQHQASKGEKGDNVVKYWQQNGLDATATQIMGGSDYQNQTWDSHGILLRKYDSIEDKYEDEQMKIVNSTIAITNDNWETVKTAIGYYFYTDSDGELKSTYGINAETIVGKLVLGNELYFSNENNTMTFDKNGLSISNGTNSFIVNPDDKNLLKIKNGDKDVFYVDQDGELHITGDGTYVDVSKNETISGIKTDISSLQELAHSHNNKSILDKIEQPYTTAERDKLAGLENYVHPSHTAHSKDMYKIAVDDEGHVTEAEVVTKSDITALGIPGEDTNTTYELSKAGNTIKMTGSDGSSSEVEVESDLNTTYTLTKKVDKITLNGSDGTTYTVLDSDHIYYLMQYYDRYGTGLNAPKVLLKGTSGDDTAITVPYTRTSASGWNPLYTECYGNLQNTDKYASLGDILFAYPDDDNGESLKIHANFCVKYGTAEYWFNVFIYTNYGNHSCVEIFVPSELSPPSIQWTVLFTSPGASEGFEKLSRVFRICIDQESMKKIEYSYGTVRIDYLTGYRGGTLEPVQKSDSVDEYLKSFHNDYPMPTNVILSSENASDVAFTGDYNDLSNKPTIPDISGKQDKLTAGTNITISGNTISAKDTTYTSKSAVSGGTDVSLVTTGEKAIWNAKTSNVGTITGIKMNGASKGTSGVVDLGTVITAHQDISGKQDKSTAVTHTANTAVGSAAKPVYVAANGVVTAITHSVNADVPANAKFTDTVYTHPTTSGNKHIPSGGSSGQILRWSADGTAVWGADNNTTYSDATQSAHGLMSAADKKKLDGMDLSKYLPKAGGVMTGDIDMATNGKDILVGSQRATNTAYATAIAGATITTKEAYSVGLPNRKSLIGSYMDPDSVWNNIISVRHRNGADDGTKYGMYLRSLLASNGNLIWNKQTAANKWQGERTLLDSANYSTYALSKDGTAKKAELLSSGQMRTAYCHNDDATFSNGYVWFKIGTAFGSGGYATITTTFLGICGYGKHALYTCRMRLTSAGNAVESITFLESGRTGGMLTGLFRIVAINGEKGVTFELWAKGAARWEGTRIAILNEQNLAGGDQPNFWTLTSRGNADAKTAPTSGNMYVDSSDSSVCANAVNATKWSNLVADISTYNTTDTRLLVNNNGKIQHRLEGDLKALSATKLATARTLTIGNTGKSFNGAANVSWSLDEIGVLGRTTKGKTYKLNNVSYNGSATDYVFNDYDANQAGGGDYICVTGSQNKALGGNCMFLAGWRNTAQGHQCVAMGQDNTVAGVANIALGSGNTVTSDAQGGLALGNLNICKANASLAGGWYTEVQKSSNQSIGYGNHVTVATASCAAFGAYNGYSFSGPYLILGNGTSSARANAFRAAAAGVYSSGSYHSSGADYAEYFEWLDGNSKGEDRRGHFVKLDGEKILLAESIEDDILGIVSGNPSVVGDSYEDQWQGQYLTDIYGEPLTEDYTDEDGTTRKVWVLNPDYDPEKVYVPRSERQEWSAVGMMGKLIVIDDGTCSPNDYCVPTIGGIATRSERRVGYRVLSRIDDTHIKVLIKG